MKKLLIVLVLLVMIPASSYAQIGAASLTVNARRGWAWYLLNDHTQPWAAWEAAFITYLEAQGIEYNKQRLEANAARRAKIEQIRLALRDATDAQITAALAALGS